MTVLSPSTHAVSTIDVAADVAVAAQDRRADDGLLADRGVFGQTIEPSIDGVLLDMASGGR